MARHDGADWEIEVPFDARLLLEVPAALRLDHAGLAEWSGDAIARSNVRPEWQSDSAGLAERLEGQVRLLSAEAVAAFLFCPRGLPGDALVEVFAFDSDARALADVPLEQDAALPQRTHPVSSPTLGEGRAIATVAALPDGVPLGQLRYQYLQDGVLIDVIAASTDLSILGIATVPLEDLAAGITVRRVEEAAR